MKRTVLFLVSAAVLLTGCLKQEFAGPQDGELTSVTFSAQMDNGVGTKAVADGDGAAASVNRCIMEVYYGDQLFTRMYAPVNNEKKASFTLQLVSNRTYKVAFWADCIANSETEDGLITDNYYTTNAEGGLQAITLKGTYVGNDDKRDAFFYSQDYTVAQAGSAFEAILKRPFAQMNVITTDVEVVKKANEGAVPEKVNVLLNNAITGFNAVTGEVIDGATSNLLYETTLYNWDSTKSECTLSMDYLFADTEKAVIDIDWKAKKAGDADVVHSFAAVPYQRNYRTNIKGALLTTTGKWNVTVDPIWETDSNGDFDYAFTSVCDIKGANDFVAKNPDKKEISVTFSTQPNDAGNPASSTDEHQINAIVTSLLAENATYNIDIASTTEVIYVGDYAYSGSGSNTTYDYSTILPEDSSATNAADVNIVVTDNLYIGTLVVNSPSKSVSINGQALQSGKSYHIENLTVTEVSLHTVIIESGMSVENLTMVKGGLEIHGIVTQVVIPEQHGKIEVRDCENLDETKVYNVLKPYIAEGYVGVKGKTTADKWDIVPARCKVGSEYFYFLSDAVAAVGDGGTICLLENINGDGVVVPGGKNFTLDFCGFTYYVDGNLAGSSGTKSQCFQLLNGSTITFKKGTIKSNIAATGINNYANLTLQDMTVDMRETSRTGQVSGIQIMNGSLNVLGNTNVYAKENPGANDSYIAILSLYWPASYGDINVAVNTTGEVKGLLAYASYQCNDLTTVKDHSHFAISNGKFDVTYDMDGLEQHDFKISGGIFVQKPDDTYIPDGYVVAENSDTSYPWKIAGPYEAMIGNTGYTTLAAAVAAVGEAETTIKLVKDVSISSNINVGNKKIILDTNGKIMDAARYVRALVVDGGKLTVVGNGKLTSVNSRTGDNSAILNLYSGELVVGEVNIQGANTCIGITGGTATINNATMKSLDGGTCVYVKDKGVANINGMTFTCGSDDPDGPGACWAQDGGTVNIYGGTFNAAPLNNKTLEPEVDQANYCLYDYRDAVKYGYVRGYVNVYGGTFIDFNPSSNYNGDSFLASGYEAVKDGGNWVVQQIANE